MSASQQADHDAFDHRLLPDDDLPDLGVQLVDEGGLFVYELVDDTDVHGGGSLQPTRPLGYFHLVC
jgi:hypothetical protein